MAYPSKTSGSSKKKSRNQKLLSAAYRQGVIERGIKNPNSQVHEAYQRGLKNAEKAKKPLV